MLQSGYYSKLFFLMKSQWRLWGELRHMTELLQGRKGQWGRVRAPHCPLVSVGIFGKSWEYKSKRVGKVTLNLCNSSVLKHSVNSEIEVHICNTNRHTWSRWLKGKFKRLSMWRTFCRYPHPPHMSYNLQFITQKGPFKKNVSSSSIAQGLKAAAIVWSRSS